MAARADRMITGIIMVLLLSHMTQTDYTDSKPLLLWLLLCDSSYLYHVTVSGSEWRVVDFQFSCV